MSFLSSNGVLYFSELKRVVDFVCLAKVMSNSDVKREGAANVKHGGTFLSSVAI